MSKFTNDLTEGNVVKKMIIFSWPFLLSMLIQSVYGLADMMIAGWFLGNVGVSAVQNGSQITLVVTNIIIGFSIGGTVTVAQYLGAKRMKDVKESIGTLFTFFLIASVVVTIVMLIFSDASLRALNTSADSFADAKNYLNICMGGTIFIVGYNALSAVMRALGDSKRPLYFVTIACFTNIFLDIILVGFCGMRAAGAAIATVVAQALSFILAVIYLRRNKFIFDFKIKSFVIYKDKLKLLFKLGIPSMAQQTLISFSFLTLTALANQVAGTSGSTVLGIAGKMNSFAILPGIAMASSIASMAGQNIGAGDIPRAKKTMHTGMIISLVIAVILFVVMQVFPEQIVSLFLLDKAEKAMITGTAVTFIRLICFDSLIMSVVFCLNGLFNGAGKTMFTLLNALVSAILLRVPLAYIFALGFGMGMTGIGIAMAVAPIGSLVLGLIYYKLGAWKKRQIIHAEL